MTSVNVTSNAWHLIVSVYDPQAAALQLFVDGQLVTQADEPARLLHAPGPVTIGSRKNVEGTQFDASFSGLIDEIAIFRKPLSGGTILEMYQAGKP